MKHYVTAEIKIVYYDVQDIITQSAEEDPYGLDRAWVGV